jgi:hypothetical protein
MEFFLPSILICIFAIGLSIAIAPKISPYVLIIGSILCIILAVYNHYSLFSNEYRIMTWLDRAKAFAPYVLTGFVVVISGGYILYLLNSGRSPSISLPASTIPPPDTATNFITRNIGQGLSAMGLTPVSKNAAANANRNRNDNIDESVLSKKF